MPLLVPCRYYAFRYLSLESGEVYVGAVRMMRAVTHPCISPGQLPLGLPRYDDQ